MTEQEYNKRPGIRRSDLWRMNESPEKYKWFLENPAESTPALVFGSAAHKYVLEKESFEEEYAVAPDVDRRTKAGKEEWEAFLAEKGDMTAVSMADFGELKAMRSAIVGNRMANSLLIFWAGETEKAFFWMDPETGEECKVKCDRLVVIDGKLYVVDYKTTASAQTERFCNEMYKYGYHVQAAMYTEGVQIAMGLKERPGFIFVAQEKKAPYSVNVIEVTEDVMNYGDMVYHRLLNRVHECKEMDDWPGYCDGEVMNEASLPGWVSMDEEE